MSRAPAKPKKARKNDVFQIRLTRQERDALFRKAKHAGKPLAAYLREKGLAESDTPTAAGE